MRKNTVQGKPARWNYNRDVQDFKIGISLQVEKIDKRGTKARSGHMGQFSDNLAMFSGVQKKVGQKKEVDYRRLGEGGGRLPLSRGRSVGPRAQHVSLQLVTGVSKKLKRTLERRRAGL